MAFANLFTSLSVVEEGGARSPVDSASTCRNEAGNGRRGNARKRKNRAGHTGPYEKKRCYQVQATRTFDTTVDNSTAVHHQMLNNDHACAGVSKEVMHHHNNKGGNNKTREKDQNYKGKNNHNVNKQQEQKWKNKTGGQKNQHHQKDRGRPAHRGGGHQTRFTRKGGGGRGNAKNEQDFQVTRKRFMTQEFKDQNALVVDGRLLCRHFLWGRCIKGDDCQLEHVQSCNDLIKESCKFYIQGHCSKGASCPYMHKSFPCKFFHRREKCSQGADCRFSHEPLDDVTNQLLDEALKRENELIELSKRAEQETSGPPANADESEMMETNPVPDIFLQPLRPNFYKIADPSAEEEASSRPTEVSEDIVPEAVPPLTCQPRSPPPANLNPAQPVCYSVEAVLGPQLSRPFTSAFTSLRSKEFAPLSSSECTTDSNKQTLVPYSVEAVLRSCKSEENSTVGHTPTHSGPVVFYTTKTYSEEVTHPLLSQETQNEKISCSVKSTNQAKESQEKSQLSLQVHTDLRSKPYPKLPLASRDHQNQSADTPEALRPAHNASHNVKSDSVCPDVRISAPSFGTLKHKSLCSRPQSSMSVSKHPMQLKPHLSVLTLDSQAYFKPLCLSPGVSQPSSIQSYDSANTVSCNSLTEQPPENHLRSKKTQGASNLGSKQDNSTETTAECSSKMENCGDLADVYNKTLNRPFRSLFVNSITDTLQPVDNSVSLSCPQSSGQPSCPDPQPADCRSNPLKPGGPDKAPASSFCSLFAVPLNAAPLSYSEQPIRSVDNPSHSSDSKQQASNQETPASQQARTEETSHVRTSSNACPSPTTGKNSSPEHINQPTEQLVDPASPPAQKQLADISSHRGSAQATPASSVLKTLFQRLSPYPQDHVEISVPSECEKDQNSTQHECEKQQTKDRKPGREKKKLQSEETLIQSTEKTAFSRESRPRTSHISSEATAWSIGMAEPQVRDPGTHNLPFKPVVPLMPHQIQPSLKHTSEGGKCMDATIAATPLKDLFKTLDSAVLHIGQ